MDESAEHAAAGDLAERQRNGGVPRHRRLEAEAPVWLVLVVLSDVLGERRFQVTTPEDEGPVQALSPYGPNEALRLGTRPWCPDRRLDHLDTFGGEHLSEAGGELRVRGPR